MEKNCAALLAGYRQALRTVYLRDWLCAALVRHVVAASARQAANRVITMSQASGGEELKRFAEEASRNDPTRSLRRGIPLLAHAGAHIVGLIAGVVGVGVVLIAVGRLIKPWPGIVGFVIGAAWLGSMAIGITGDLYRGAVDRMDGAKFVLSQHVDEPEDALFRLLLPQRPPRRTVLDAIPLFWTGLWLVPIILILVGFTLGALHKL